MNFLFRRTIRCLLAAGALFSLTVSAQTLILTNGVQIYGALTNTTVTMSNRCELWVTNSTTPLSGCTINLNSIDAWLFLPGVKPSVVAATYLSQVKISNAGAVADSNCRVVQYGQNGAVVIPQPSSFQPLTVFTGAESTGTATSYSQWTYYTGSGISNIRSFKLKRGYQVVFAQSSNGKNWSKCYVAQDGDLEIGGLPTTLDKQVQFIYVTPWRWTSKKGIAGNPPYSWLNVNWWYDWNLDQSSSRDLEYVAIRQNQYWPGLSQNWQSLGINTVLGYNEPDQANQANMSVSTAISAWGDLLGTGLRVGSPATSDGGPSTWLIPFVSQADAAGLRVDFAAIHYYQSHNPADASGCASQMYSFLLNLWNNTHRPIWVTEWNNGANWTDSQWPAPTYAQQQACIAAMTAMLESTPFVERYALYNWVEDTRSLVTSSNTVTLAGTTYSNLVSNLSYSQAMPDNGTRGIAEFLFATNLWDTSGYYNNGMAIGVPSFTVGHNSQATAIALDGTNSYVQLPANIAKGGAFTFAAWVYWNGGNNWQRIFDFGDPATSQSGPSQYMFLTPSSGSGTLRFAINSGSGEQIVQRTAALASGSWQHVAVTLNGSAAILYVNGAAVATSNSVTLTPSAFSPIKNYLGKSQFTADPRFNGKLDEVEIADFAMTPAQISVLYNSTQNPSFISGVWTNNASGNWGTSNNWSGGTVANGASRIADFSTINITANQTVTLDSARTIGGLRFGDTTGAQTWTLAGANPLTLDGGGANVPLIAVNQNTATISTPLSGSYGFTKTGTGTLTLNATNAVGGGLSVSAGAVNISGGATVFGSGTSSVGYLTGSGTLTMTGGTLAAAGEFRVGGSDQSGSQYVATGAVTVANATLSVGSLTVARGNYLDNTISGTLTLNGGSTLVSTNDAIVEFAGMGRGKLVLNGGNFILGPTATKWLVVGYYDSGAGELDITNGNIFLDNGSSLKMCRSGNTGGNVVNQIGGNVTCYSDAGVTAGGGGNLDLNYAGGASSTNTYNLNGGTLTVPQIIATTSTATRIFNFNGGTLKAAAANAAFFASSVASSANVRNFGAKIDTAGVNVTIGQALQHSAIAGDSATDGGLTKNGAGTLTLAGANTFTGTTTINAGALVLGSGGSIANSRNIAVAGGAGFDVSAIPGFTIGAAQTLSGSGTITGAVAIAGTLAPGFGAIGTLTMSQPPALNGVTIIRINRNNGAPLNDQINLPSAAITYGGTLTVNNIGAALTAGDSFQIFSATSYNGAFATLNLPALGAGLAWNTNALTNGTLSVIATVPPQFGPMTQTSDGNFQFSGTGAAGVTYELDAATNLAPPIFWLFVTNAVADQNGLFQLWDLTATNFPQRFYRVTSGQ
jgi:autotransporter-associated beta strand protein